MVAGATFALALASLGGLGCSGPAVSPASFLVEDEIGINGLAVDDFDVYFIRRDGHLKKVSLDGGKAIELVSGIDNPMAIALDKDAVYWATSGGAIGSIPKKGGDAASLVDGKPGLVGPASLALGQKNVYFASAGSMGVQAVPKEGGAPVSVFGGGVTSTGGSFAFDGGGFLYAMNGQGELLGIATDGTSSAVIADQQTGTTRIAADSSFVYWVNPTPPGFDPTSEQAQGKVLRAKPDGSDLLEVAVNQKDPFQIAGDEKNIYWTSTSGSVSMAPVEGNTDPFVMSSGPAGEIYLALDKTTLYWARAEGGTITALPKPQDASQ